MTIRVKLITAFVIILVLMIFLGISAYLSLDRMERSAAAAMRQVELAHFFNQKKEEHLDWVDDLRSTIFQRTEFKGQLDPRQCKFGRWYYENIESPEFDRASPLLRDKLLALEKPHRDLHDSAGRIIEFLAKGRDGDRAQALSIFNMETQRIINEMGRLLDEIGAIYNGEKESILLYMESQSLSVRRLLVGTILASIIVAGVITFFLSRAIIKPLVQMISTAEQIAEGDLSNGRFAALIR